MSHSLLLRIAVCTGFLSALWIVGIAGESVVENAVTQIKREGQSAAVFFVTSITPTQIQETYARTSEAAANKKVKILIVPGHQPTEGGTQFRDVYEREIVVQIARALAGLLERNPHYEVLVARDDSGWNPVLQTYFDTHEAEIDSFMQTQKFQMDTYLAQGLIEPQGEQIEHNDTPRRAQIQLYGINKWASENHVDIVLHLHINDYGGRRKSREGTYSGFTIYVPDHQYSNAQVSYAVGQAIANRLSAVVATSTLPTEDKGVVEDQELIAIGKNNTVDGAALLIEYGYIYEPQLQLDSVRPLAVEEYAYQTYLGLQDFFNDTLPGISPSVLFPYDWSQVTAEPHEEGSGVYALQTALHVLGYYPPAGRTFSECPIAGVVGPCTRRALEVYQQAQGLEVTGTVGPKTRAALTNDTATLGMPH